MAGGGAETLHLKSPLYMRLLNADTTTGKVDEIIFDSYPLIINCYDVPVNDESEMYLFTTNALQQPGVVRLTFGPTAYEPVSGHVLGPNLNLLEDGPPTANARGTALVLDGYLYQLTGMAGLVQVEIASGNRRMVSSSRTERSVRTGPELSNPQDMVWTPDGRLFVLDGSQGLMEVNGQTGDRHLLLNGGLLPVASRRM